MRNQLNEELKTAMKAQDKRRVSTLRLINTAVKDRDIAARGIGKENVGDEEILLILTKMVKQREESAKTYEEAGRLDLSEQEREEIAIIQDFLPKQLDQAEVEAAVTAVVKDLDAGGLKDMGRTMAALKDKYPGKMDFGLASKLVKEMLTK